MACKCVKFYNQKGDGRMAEVKPRVPTEEQEQITLFNWAAMMNYKYPELRYMYHVPNGGYRNKAEAGRFRAQGVKSGVPDIVLPVARGGYHGLYIEMKVGKNTTSDSQEWWIEHLRKQGYKVAVCYGWEEAAAELTEYLSEV